MSWDAGAIEASLTVDTAKASADLDKIEARVKRLTDTPHKIRISAVFDDASTGRALAAFRSLDNAISRDAMQRLRSSPQGSVLGALNALFSPHPVTGAPSPQQAASQGLLGKMFTPGGENATPAGDALRNAVSGAGPGNTSSQNMIRQVVTGAGPGNVSTDDMIRQVLTGAAPGNVSTQDMIKQVLTGNTPGNVSTQDMIKQVLTGAAPGNVSTEDLIKQVVTGKAPGNIDTTDTVHEKLDEASKAKVITDSTDSGDKAGAGFSSMFTVHARSLLTAVGGMFGGGGGGITDEAKKGGDDAGKGFISDFSVKILAGIGPVILGLRLKMAAVGTAVGAGLAALPALGGVIGAGLGVALIGGAIAGVVATSPKLKAQFTAIGADAKQVLVQAGAAIVPALSAVMGQIPALLKSVEPQLAGIFKTVAPQIQGVFNGLKPIISGVIGLMQAAAPAFGPFIKSIELLVSNLFPGLIMITKAVVPVMGQFTGIMSSLGKNLGALFGDMAPAVKASMTVLGALLGLIGGLLPVIAKLADIFAVSLAPVITQFAGVIKALEPTLVVIGKVIGDLAGAILGDLVSAFTALATLVIGISPALNAFAKAISQVFTVLENTGVFAILGDAIENLAKPLAGLISAFLTGLVPILPPVIAFIGQLSTLIASSLSSAVATLIPPLTRLVTGVFQALNAILPVVLPLLLQLAGIFTGAVVSAVSALATALAAIIDAIPPSVLGGIVIGILAIVGAMKAWAVIQAAMDVLMDANPLGLIVIAIGLLVVAVTELVTHWSTVWAAIQSAASTVWNFLVSDIFDPMATFFTTTIPGWFDTVSAAVTTHFVTPVENAFTTAWTDITSAITTAWNAISAFFTTWWTDTLNGWKTDISAFESIFSAAWTSVENTAKTVWNAIASFFTTWWSTVTATFRSDVSTVESVLSAAWTTVRNAITTAWGAIVTYFQGIPGKLLSALSSLGGDLTNYGKTVLNDFLNGVKAVWTTVESWFSGLPSQILHALGINSPPQWALDAGKHIMNGLLSSFAHGASDVKAFFVGLASDITGPLKAAWSAVTSAFAGGGAPAGSGVVAAWITAALNAAGAPASWLPLLEVLVSKECVPLRTQILTRRGWVDHDQVQVGDETIGYNLKASRSEWTRITKIHHPGRAETVRFGNAYWSAECTPNHRWLMEEVQFDWRGYAAAREHAPGDRAAGHEWVSAETLTELQYREARQRLVLARRAETPGLLTITAQEAAVIGWLMGDGHVRKLEAAPVVCPDCGWVPKRRKPSQGPVKLPGRSVSQHRINVHGFRGRSISAGSQSGTGWSGSIFQAKPGQVVRLRALLADIPHGETVRRPRRGHRLPEHEFYLRRAYVNDLFTRARWGECGPEQFVLALSTEQRAAWLAAIIDAEGSARADGSIRIYQDDGPVADAIELAIYLSGYRPGRGKRSVTRNKAGKPNWAFSLASSYIAGPSRRHFAEDAGVQDVWCVTTELGTWTARQDGQVFLTGNSGGNPAAVDPISVDGEHASGLFQTLPSTYAQYATVAGGVFNPISDAVAGIRYIMAEYGSPANIPGLTGGTYVGYAGGGMITEPITGWGASGTLYKFGERGSELVTPASGGAGGASIGDVVNRLERLISVASQIPASTGQHVGSAIGGSAAAASFRARYPRGGA